MPIDCNKHCSDEQNIICGLQNQLAKLELQQTPQQRQQQNLLDMAIDKLKDDIQNAVVDHKTCITACELRNRGCDGGGGGKKSKKRNKARRKYRKIKSRRRRAV